MIKPNAITLIVDNCFVYTRAHVQHTFAHKTDKNDNKEEKENEKTHTHTGRESEKEKERYTTRYRKCLLKGPTEIATATKRQRESERAEQRPRNRCGKK